MRLPDWIRNVGARLGLCEDAVAHVIRELRSQRDPLTGLDYCELLVRVSERFPDGFTMAGVDGFMREIAAAKSERAVVDIESIRRNGFTQAAEFERLLAEVERGRRAAPALDAAGEELLLLRRVFDAADDAWAFISGHPEKSDALWDALDKLKAWRTAKAAAGQTKDEPAVPVVPPNLAAQLDLHRADIVALARKWWKAGVPQDSTASDDFTSLLDRVDRLIEEARLP